MRFCSDSATSGRLAQLVEHLVYTERVGGSNPSPPTKRSELSHFRRLAWLALAVSAFTAAWTSGTPAALAAEQMSFRPEIITAGTACRRNCSRTVSAEVISATGEITNSTADEFLAFLHEHVQDQQLRPVVLIHSPGGTVVGAMQLGMMFRKLGAAVIVARTIEEEGADRAHVLPGSCMSACVYAFFGGSKRVVPTVSRLGIHRMAIYGHERDPAGGDVATRTYGTDDIVSALSSYTKMMGVNPEVIDYAEQISPETIHIVTPREIQRWRLGSPRL